MQVPLPGILKDLLALLEQWPAWKRVKGAPDRIDELEKRVAALESMLSRPPGERCPYCGATELRLQSEASDPTFGVLGVKRQTWACGACGKTTERQQ